AAQDISTTGAVLGSVGVPSFYQDLTFDELPSQPVNGLHFKGVTFGYQQFGSPSSDARYGAYGPGSTAFVSDPSLEGSTYGVLTLTFDTPVTDIQFGVVLSTGLPLSPGATVDLYDASSTLIASIPMETSYHGYFYPEALFQYSGAAA